MLTVFILAFGVSSYSLIYGVQQFSWHLPRRIINLAYWQIFGELNALEEFEGKVKFDALPAIPFLCTSILQITIKPMVTLLLFYWSRTWPLSVFFW